MSKPSRKRRNPPRQTSKNRGQCPIRQECLPIPHSDAWFEASLETNTQQAMLTGIVVDRAGRLDVCSICGEDPAPVYELPGDPGLPLRLCKYCLEIRTWMFEEHFRPRCLSGSQDT